MEPRRGPLTAGEKVQFTDRKGKKITDQLVAGGSTQTEHGLILHDRLQQFLSFVHWRYWS